MFSVIVGTDKHVVTCCYARTKLSSQQNTLINVHFITLTIIDSTLHYLKFKLSIVASILNFRQHFTEKMFFFYSDMRDCSNFMILCLGYIRLLFYLQPSAF